MARYATTNELKDQIGKTGVSSDAELEILLDAVSQFIDTFCNRPDGFDAATTATARTYVGSGGVIQWIDPCVQVTQVSVKDSPSDTTYTAWAAADWIAATGDPTTPDFNHTPYTFIVVSAVGDYDTFTSGHYEGLRGFRPDEPQGRGVPTVQVTARWCESDEVPPLIKQATIAQAARWYKRGQSGWADILTMSEFGTLQFRTNVQSALDPDIRAMLTGGRFIRPAIGRRY